MAESVKRKKFTFDADEIFNDSHVNTPTHAHVSVSTQEVVNASSHTPVSATTQTPSHVNVSTHAHVKESKTKRTHILLRPSVHQKLVDYKETTGTTINDLVNTLIDKFIEENNL